MKPAEHVPLRFRKVLTARLICLPLLYPDASILNRAKAKEAFRSTRAGLKELTENALRYPEPGQLDEFLAELLDDLQAQAAPWKKKGVSSAQPIERALFHIGKAIQGLSCQACAAGKKAICDGKSVDEDSAIVAQNGQCLRHFSNMVDMVAGVALAYYSKFSSVFNNLSSKPKIVFSTHECGAAPHQFPVPFSVGGVTEFEDVADAPVSRISLEFWVERFDWETYLACLYVVFHECICHLFEGLTRQPRKEAPTGDPFAEGWMDFVAVTILRECLDHSSDTVPSFSVVDIGQLRIAEIYQYGRLDFNNEKAAPYADLWAVGNEAARKVQLLFESLVPDRKAARARFFQFSFDFNVRAYEWSDSEREALQSILAKYLPLNVLQPERKHFKQFSSLVRLMRKYLNDNDLDALIAGVLDLWEH